MVATPIEIDNNENEQYFNDADHEDQRTLDDDRIDGDQGYSAEQKEFYSQLHE